MTMEQLHGILNVLFSGELPKGVISIDLRSSGAAVHMRPDEFLAEFSEYKCSARGSLEYPYELSAQRDGTRYFVIVEDLRAGKPVAETEGAGS
jgi:hypothetical protein